MAGYRGLTGSQARLLLLCTAAAGALCAAGPAFAGPDLCTVAGATVTCSGNQSGGIEAGVDFDPQSDALIIENLNQDIGSGATGAGVSWVANAANGIDVTSDTGAFAIRADTVGFDLRSATDQSILLDHAGDIFAGDDGVVAFSQVTAGTGFVESGFIQIDMQGDIVADDTGIFAASRFALGDGDSGDVTIDYIGDLVTTAPGRSAIIAESSTDANGDAGIVDVETQGDITGHVFVESRVEQNGNSGFAQIAHFGSMTGIMSARSVVEGDGAAGNVSVIAVGDVTGNITAESIVDGAGASGDVDIGVEGDVTAFGVAITARSIGSAGQGNIDLTIGGGTVSGLAGAILIEGGAINTLAIDGDAAVASAIAITGGDGDETIFNLGLVSGEVSLGAGINRFENDGGARFETGTVVNLGGLGVLDNSGTMSVGRFADAAVTTALTGDLNQDGLGVLEVDIIGGVSDRLDVSGVADLDGLVRATVQGVLSSTQQFTILTAAGGIIDDGIDIEDTFIFDFELLVGANDLILQVTADFTPADLILTPNQQAVAEHLDDALTAGGGNLGAIFDHLGGILDPAAFAAALDRLHPEPYLAQTQSILFSSLSFADGMMSCPVNGDKTVSKYLAEGECGWMRLGGRHLERDRSVENIGFDDDVWSASLGAQKEIAPNRFVSLSAGYDNSDQRVDDRARADGNVFHAGIAYKEVRGNWQFSGALSGGYAQYDTTRLEVLPGVNAQGDARYGFASARVRTAYLLERESLYVKPLVDMDVTAIHRRSFHEWGAGGAGLDVASGTDVLLSLAPALEIGGTFTPDDRMTLRPFARAGLRAFSDDDLSVSATFYSLPQLEPLTVTTPMDQIMGQVSAGVDLVHDGKFDARISYDGMFGEETVQHAGNVKLRMKF